MLTMNRLIRSAAALYESYWKYALSELLYSEAKKENDKTNLKFYLRS